MNNKHTFTIHEVITISFLASILYYIISFCKYYHYHNSDERSYLDEVTIVFNCIKYWLILTSMAMASKGWCIIYEKLPTIDIVKSLFYSLLFAIPQVLLDNFDFGFIRFVVFGIEMAGMINYYWYLCEASLHALRIIVGHLYVIKEKNINPKSTPIYRNLIIFAFIMIGVLIYIVLVSFSVLIQLADIPYWVDSFINDLITSIFLIFIGFHFRLKNSLKNGYMVMIENVNENEEPQEFTKEQLTEIFNNYKEVLNGTNLNDYSAGDILPPQPIEIKGENEKKGCC